MDRSGSMGGLESDMIGGFNGMIELVSMKVVRAVFISGNKITIEDCTYIERNHRILEKDGKYRKINQDKISLSDRVSIFLCMNSAGGRCHDNARCESMWARFKEELLYGRYNTTSMTVEQLKILI